jgi:hypothetical protein
MSPRVLAAFSVGSPWAREAAHPRQRRDLSLRRIPARPRSAQPPACSQLALLASISSAAATVGTPLTISMGPGVWHWCPPPPGYAGARDQSVWVGSQARLDLPGTPDRLSHQPIRRYYCAFNTFSIMFQNIAGNQRMLHESAHGTELAHATCRRPGRVCSCCALICYRQLKIS